MAHGTELSAVAARYAGALLDVARSESKIAEVERDLDRVAALLGENADLRRLVRSPVINATDQRRALETLLAKLNLGRTAHNFLLLLANKRRLFTLESIIAEYKVLAAKDRGEVQAEVVSAVALTSAQYTSLVDTLRQQLGKAPQLSARVDPKLLGGLVLKVGSRMIDTSIRTKLKTLENAMKEAV